MLGVSDISSITMSIYIDKIREVQSFNHKDLPGDIILFLQAYSW